METSAPNLDQRPNVVVWEVSRACDLACSHCRSAAQSKRSTLELSTFEGYDLIEQVALLGPELFTFSGGDPLKRADIFELVEFAGRRGLATSLATSATPMLTFGAINRLKQAGLGRMAVALDGPSAEVHDGVRGVSGSYRVTMDSIRHALSIGLPVEIDTMISRFNLSQIESLMQLLAELRVVAWNLHFYVPAGPGTKGDMISAQEAERVFALIYGASRAMPFEIRTTEAMHYRRYVLQRVLRENPELARRVFEIGLNYSALVSSMQTETEESETGKCPHPLESVNDARSYLFVSHIGEVYPSSFLPLSGGNIRFRPLAHIYRNSPLFAIVRDGSELTGKCGVCEFKEVCGGSRARAYMVEGDPMAPEPLCAYQPAVLREEAFAEH